MKKSLDPIDLKLIEMLSENARRPLVALAKGLGLSRSATQERLERLQASGVNADTWRSFDGRMTPVSKLGSP